MTDQHDAVATRWASAIDCSTVRVIRADDATVMPWRNGGGTTREYASHPTTGDFSWRVSVARVDSDGPFSEFSGCDRILVLLGGDGMTLRSVEGEDVTLTHPLDLHRFPGEVPLRAELLDGPTTDLNLIWRRDLWEVDVARTRTPHTVEGGDTMLVYVARGVASGAHGGLASGDLLVTDSPMELVGDASLVVFRLRAAARARTGWSPVNS